MVHLQPYWKSDVESSIGRGSYRLVLLYDLGLAAFAQDFFQGWYDVLANNVHAM